MIHMLNMILFQWLFIRITKLNNRMYLIGFILPMSGWFGEYKYIITSFKITLIKFVNVFILQWLFIRLAHDENRYYIIGLILPLTGWWSDYVEFCKFSLPLLKK